MLTIPAFICAAALSGCGGGNSPESERLSADVIGTAPLPTQADAVDSAAAIDDVDVSADSARATYQLRKVTHESGGPAPAPAPAPEASTPVYSDGSARINALLASSTSVAIPAGVYMISAQLNIRDGQTIAPALGAQVIFKAAAGYTGSFIATVDKSFTLRGITFDGNYAGRTAQEGATAANLLTINGGNNVTLENNTFQYAPAHAVWAYRSASLQIRGNSFVECWHSIRLDGNGLPSGAIENNTFTNTAAYNSIQHITAINTANLVVRGNTMSGAGVGVPTNHGYEGTWGNSIYIFNSDGYLVENNAVSRNYWSSIVVGQNSTNAIVRGNKFSHGVHGGTTGGLQSSWIEQAGNHSITFTNNILVGGLSAGDTGGDYLTITYNDITVPPGGTGINADFMFKHGLIANNTIREANGSRTSTGIFLWNKNTSDVSMQVNNNVVSGFSRGIAINNDGGVGTVYGIRLSGNTFSNNTTNVWVPSAIKLDQPLGQ